CRGAHATSSDHKDLALPDLLLSLASYLGKNYVTAIPYYLVFCKICHLDSCFSYNI
ncbi:hypothetical protein HKBW3S03_01965, partial [Candidatus Hakubella thermalkaliphila]